MYISTSTYGGATWHDSRITVTRHFIVDGKSILFLTVAKAIEIIFEKFPEHAYWAIIGLIVASPVAILLLNSFGTLNVVSVLTGVAALAAGVVIALKLGEE